MLAPEVPREVGGGREMKKKLIGGTDVVLTVRVAVPAEEARLIKSLLAMEGSTLRAFVAEQLHKYVILRRRPS